MRFGTNNIFRFAHKFPLIKKFNRFQPKTSVMEDIWLRQIPIKTFIDIGAYVGEYIDFASKLYPNVEIYAFEPLPSAIKILNDKAKQNQHIHVFPYALGDTNTNTFIYQSSYKPSSSILPMALLHKKNFPHTKKLEKMKMEIRSLDFVLQNVKLHEKIFIKVDTQGYEDKVISGGKHIFKKASIILIEVSFQELYHGQKLFHEIYSQIFDLGFLLYGFRNQIISPQNGSILQAHAYFLNRSKLKYFDI